MAAKLKLKPDPTFTALVDVRMPGGEVAKLGLTFKYRTKTQRNEWLNSIRDKEDADVFMSMVEAWDLEVPYDRENVVALLEAYDGTAILTVQKYLDELTGARRGNS